MNRQERRKRAKSGNVTDKDLRHIQEETKKAAINESVDAVMASVLLALRDEFGWGAKRAQRLTKHVHETFEAVGSGYLSLKDMKQTIENELGIVLRDE